MTRLQRHISQAGTSATLNELVISNGWKVGVSAKDIGMGVSTE